MTENGHSQWDYAENPSAQLVCDPVDVGHRCMRWWLLRYLTPIHAGNFAKIAQLSCQPNTSISSEAAKAE
jgi:hypothetical protein